MAVGDALDGLIRDRGWTTEVSARQLLGRWASLVGQVVAEHTTPEAFRDGVVAVRADSTAWASQLRLLAPQVVAKLNAALGDGTVKRIQVLAPEAPSWKHGILAHLGWAHDSQADVAQGWKRILGTVRSYTDLEPAILAPVEELIDFVTVGGSGDPR